MDAIKATDATVPLRELDFSSITAHLAKHDVFRYQGSLTTPPCTEGLEWIVSKEPLQVDIFLFNSLKKIMKFNSRYTQSAPGEANMLDAEAMRRLASSRNGSVHH